METLTLHIPPAVGLTDEQFYQLCIVEIYRLGQAVETLQFSADHPPQLSGEEVLPGFVLDLTLIFTP